MPTPTPPERAVGVRRSVHLLAFVLLGIAMSPAASAAGPTALVIHGGAGVIVREQLSEADEIAVRADLDRALDAGHAVLARGGAALDAVTAAVQVLEDSPWFNAGKGAVYTADATHELDAAVMEGHTRRAGAVAGVRTVRNPVRLARAVMEHSPHVFLVADGAEAFADTQPDIERVRNDWFDTRVGASSSRWRASASSARPPASPSRCRPAPISAPSAPSRSMPRATSPSRPRPVA